MDGECSKEPIAKRPRKGEQNDDQDSEKSNDIPKFDLFSLDQLSSKDFLDSYQRYQAVHIRGISKLKTGEKKNSNPLKFCWKDILSVYENLEKSDQTSWCIENLGANKEDELTFKTFLAPQITTDRAYCSFLVQKDKEKYEMLLERLPLTNLSPSVDSQWTYEPCLWIFFGRNSADKGPLEGRSLHTDSVSHDGTWHYQLSGEKEWYISPSCDLLKHWKERPIPQEFNESTKIRIHCQEGDVLIVNTKLWFHRTVIPSQTNPSVSYARDFRLAASSNCEGQGGMTNLDGLYARNEIEAGTVIFTENDMPECELHRSKGNPNCEVVELEDGISAVVSKRAIACGEFFCVAESSDEEDGEDEEEESYEEEGGDD